MGFLNNATRTIDAILTKKGRELLARGQNEFKVTKFALSDDEIDYTLWDVTHPNGSNYYGQIIEAMPVLEAFPDENQIMRYKLVTLPKATTKMPILQLPASSLTFSTAGITDTITPNTLNASDATAGYTFILHDSSLANMVVTSGQSVPNQGATTPVFLDDDDLTNNITVVARSVSIISRALSTAKTSQITIVGNETGATYTIPITVRATVSTTTSTS
jgi:hypothetical protein